MKKAEPIGDELRSEYQREHLGTLVRGKYAARYAKATNVVVIDPALTIAFPNSDAVNEALRGLLALATSAARLTVRSRKTVRNPTAEAPAGAAGSTGRARPRVQRAVAVRN
jgi:hypothetical protein